MEVYRHLHSLSPRFYARASIGDLISRLTVTLRRCNGSPPIRFFSSLSNLLFVAGSIAHDDLAKLEACSSSESS